ncbi:ATPase, partial [Streptomyces sp. NPDC052196]
AAEHAERVELEREQRAVLGGLGLPTYELPLIGGGMDVAGLYRLATELRKLGVGE